MICEKCLHVVPAVQGHLGKRHQACPPRKKGNGTPRNTGGFWLAIPTDEMKLRLEQRANQEPAP